MFIDCVVSGRAREAGRADKRWKGEEEEMEHGEGWKKGRMGR